MLWLPSKKSPPRSVYSAISDISEVISQDTFVSTVDAVEAVINAAGGVNNETVKKSHDA